MNHSGFDSIGGNLIARDSVFLGLILLFALAVRLLTFNGAFGSDDLTYYSRAVELAQGSWTSANYNGALRYGFNLPAAVFIALFGESIFVANLWPLTCSLIEIAAVYVFAKAAINKRTGIIAALLLATAPLHIAVATRIHADPVVSMFLTLGFVLLYFGVVRRQQVILFCAGLAIGGVFWVKELAAVTWVAFLPLLWLFRDEWRSSLYVIAGATLMLLLHGLLMYSLAGDPLHLIKVVMAAMKRGYIDVPENKDTSAWYYLRYLFVDIRHTGLLGFLALVSLFLSLLPKDIGIRSQAGFFFVSLWFVALLVVLSVFPVSLSPLRFPMKQSNYITLFLGPTALLAGAALSVFPKVIRGLTLAACLIIGLLLGGLQQADYRIFTSNTKALAAFAVAHPSAVVIGSANNSGLGSLWTRLEHPSKAMARIIGYRELEDSSNEMLQMLEGSEEVYVVIDRQTNRWFAGKIIIESPLDCWSHVQKLTPTGFGLGNDLAGFAHRAFSSFGPVATVFARLHYPLQADIYLAPAHDVLCVNKRDTSSYER